MTQSFMDECVMAKINGTFSATDAAKAKWWTSQIQNEVIDACVQIFGGYGYMNEYRIARAWQDARVTKIWAGSNEIMKELIGRELGFRLPHHPQIPTVSPFLDLIFGSKWAIRWGSADRCG